MSMKPILALRLSQQLRMTPQLQQAIKLLQLSTFDLEQEIQEALDSNLMLEEIATEDETGDEPTSLDTPNESIEGQVSETDASPMDSAQAENTDQPPPPNPEIDGGGV